VDIIRAAAEGAAWSEIKRYLEIKHGVIHDPEFARLLKALLDEGFLVKEGGLYKVADPYSDAPQEGAPAELHKQAFNSATRWRRAGG